MYPYEPPDSISNEHFPNRNRFTVVRTVLWFAVIPVTLCFAIASAVATYMLYLGFGNGGDFAIIIAPVYAKIAGIVGGFVGFVVSIYVAIYQAPAG